MTCSLLMPHTYGLVAGNMILGYTSLGDDEHWRSLHRRRFSTRTMSSMLLSLQPGKVCRCSPAIQPSSSCCKIKNFDGMCQQKLYIIRQRVLLYKRRISHSEIVVINNIDTRLLRSIDSHPASYSSCQTRTLTRSKEE